MELNHRVGLEFELLAPRGLERADVGAALAKAIRGRVAYGFKYYSEGQLPDGRPLCLLSDAVRVLDSGGKLFATLVDDNTIHPELPKSRKRTLLRSTDDVRLALLAERHCWSSKREGDARLASLAALFGTQPSRGTVHDAVGHHVVVQLQENAEHRRVCEIVTRPLLLRERPAVISRILEVAAKVGLVIPRAAALHAHYDAAPWQQVGPLQRLILQSSDAREAWARQLRPNPHCLRLGPFSPLVQRVAREAAAVSFETFAAALHLAGAQKWCDFNVLGVIEPHPRQPTLEVRCLPMSLNPEQVLASLHAAESLLKQVQRPVP